MDIQALHQELRATPYEPVVAVGRGGMGELFEVRHRSLGRRYVVKLLRDPRRTELQDRLRLEAQTLARLAHPNLLQVIDLGRTSSGWPFLVTERLYGRTLREVAERGPVSLPDACRWGCAALRGLGVAHAAGLVHRDVKPDNLFLCEGAGVELKVIDFGVVKVMGGPASDWTLPPLAVPTGEGVALGTPNYMAPEQLGDGPVDARSDLYSLAVVLFRLLTGRLPFPSNDLAELAWMQSSSEPPSAYEVAGVPRALSDILARALSRDPAKRYQAAVDFGAALEPFVGPMAAPTPPKTVIVPVPAGRPTPTVAGFPVEQPTTPVVVPEAHAARLDSPRPLTTVDRLALLVSAVSVVAIAFFAALLVGTFD
jgi:eukaryotic-like serine/threonine-protein kinase